MVKPSGPYTSKLDFMEIIFGVKIEYYAFKTKNALENY